MQIGGQSLAEQLPQLHRVTHFGDDGRDVAALAGVEDDAEDEDGEDGADGAEGHKAEAVVRRVAVRTDGRDTDAQSHDEGNGHGTRGDAAGVKGYGKELLRHEGGQKEDGCIEDHQQPGERDAQQHAQEGHDEEEAHAHGHREDEGHVGDGGHLVRKHLQIRLRDGDEEAQQEACPDDEEDVLAAGEHGTDPFAHRRHAHLRAQREEHDADDDHGRTQQKAEQDARGNGGDAETEDQHDGRDGQDGLKRLQQLFPELGEG